MFGSGLSETRTTSSSLLKPAPNLVRPPPTTGLSPVSLHPVVGDLEVTAGNLCVEGFGASCGLWGKKLVRNPSETLQKQLRNLSKTSSKPLRNPQETQKPRNLSSPARLDPEPRVVGLEAPRRKAGPPALDGVLFLEGSGFSV